jgi:maltooligosyltrehalose trehalohydrolase
MDFGQPEQLAKALRDFFVYDGCFSPYRKREFGTPVGAHSGEHFVIAIQNHDQVGNRALGERFGTLLPPPQQRLAATLLLLAPNVPLLFMGEEYGETRPFPFFCDFGESSLIEAVRRGRAQEFASFAWPERLPDPFAPETFASARLSWSWDSDRHRSGLRKWYRTLLRARREWPALRNFVLRDAHWYPGSNPTQGVVELIRGDAAAGPAVAAYFNFSSAPQAIPPGARLHQAPAAWQAVLSSEQSAYDGARDELTWRNSTGHDLLPYEAQIFTLSERNST